MHARTHTHLKEPAQVTLLQEAMAPLETASEPALCLSEIYKAPFSLPTACLGPLQSVPTRGKEAS